MDPADLLYAGACGLDRSKSLGPLQEYVYAKFGLCQRLNDPRLYVLRRVGASVVVGCPLVGGGAACWSRQFFVTLLFCFLFGNLRLKKAGWPPFNYRSLFTAEALLLIARLTLTVYTFSYILSWAQVFRGFRSKEDPRITASILTQISNPHCSSTLIHLYYCLLQCSGYPRKPCCPFLLEKFALVHGKWKVVMRVLSHFLYYL
ncbi:hypothetical protein GWK47_049743 [Chionoecetes opilio]|uniref:Uncharacterized protein n=1 Tax=Chionoecetes opilio TaxID=41210 RepID=A0A8J4YBH3_CHIOP|nr:hypothetical protein GWK47_049743 [Chionoecetes opilio]